MFWHIHIRPALTLSWANMSALQCNNSFTMAALSGLGISRLITDIRGLHPSYAKGECEWRAFVGMSCVVIVIMPSYMSARHTLLNASSALQVFLISRRSCGISVNNSIISITVVFLASMWAPLSNNSWTVPMLVFFAANKSAVLKCCRVGQSLVLHCRGVEY